MNVSKRRFNTILQRAAKDLPCIDELVASVIVALLVWGIGTSGLELVNIEEGALATADRIYLLLAAPLFLGIMSYLLVKWSHGYKGPNELIAVLHEKSSAFPGWIRATATWIIACIELGSGMSPKGFEGPYIAAGGGLSGLLATKLSLDSAARRRLARCGLGIAFGLLFRTPLGGLICIFEFGKFERSDFKKQLPTALIATTVNFWLMETTKLPTPYEALPRIPSMTPHSFLMLVLTGVACGLIGILYVLSIRWAKRLFKALELYVPPVAIPVIGASVSTAAGAFFPVVLGFNGISRLFAQQHPIVPLVLVGAIVAKIIATASADGSKMAGGTVGPAILLGGLVGEAIGGLNPLIVTAGSAAIIGPAAGIPLTMLATAITWLGFTPLALVSIVPLAIAKVICWEIELYPYTPLPKGWPVELD